MTSATLPITLAEIDASNRLRPIDQDWAAAIAASLKNGKLDTPISLRATPDAAKPYRLVYGGHRLAALEIAGITVLHEGSHFALVSMDENEARIAEIDENLMRRELSAVDRAIFLAERKRVWDALYPETGHGGDRRSRAAQEKIKRTKSPFDLPATFTKEAAEKTGLSDRTIRRAVALAGMLDDELLADLRATDIADNAAQLKSLMREAPLNRVRIVAAIKAGHARNVANARRALGLMLPSEKDPHQQAADRLITLWERTSPKARRVFLDHIGVDDVEAGDLSQAAA